MRSRVAQLPQLTKDCRLNLSHLQKSRNPYKIQAKFVSGQDDPTTMYEAKETSILKVGSKHS